MGIGVRSLFQVNTRPSGVARTDCAPPAAASPAPMGGPAATDTIVYVSARTPLGREPVFQARALSVCDVLMAILEPETITGSNSVGSDPFWVKRIVAPGVLDADNHEDGGRIFTTAHAERGCGNARLAKDDRG